MTVFKKLVQFFNNNQNPWKDLGELSNIIKVSKGDIYKSINNNDLYFLVRKKKRGKVAISQFKLNESFIKELEDE